MRWASDAEETSRATIRRSEGEGIKDKHKRENGETAKRDLSTAINRRSEKRNYPTLATEARMGHQKLGPETRMGAKFGWAHLSRGLGGMI
jgi:hypothetical protein